MKVDAPSQSDLSENLPNRLIAHTHAGRQDHSIDLLCSHDVNGRLISISNAPARILGYTVAELINSDMRDLLPPEHRDGFDDYIAKLLRDGVAEGLMVLLTRVGERRTWEYHCFLCRGIGNAHTVEGIAHDVTERIQAENALRRANELNRTILASVGGLIVYDVNKQCLMASPHAIGPIHLEMQSKLQVEVTETPSSALKIRTESLEKILLGAEAFVTPDYVVTRAGREVWISEQYRPLYGRDSGVVGVIVVQRDITTRKQTLEAIRTVVERVDGESGAKFFASMAVQLAKCLGADHTIIGELLKDDQERVQTLGVCLNGSVAEDFVYHLAGTPCEGVAKASVCSFLSGVATLFPDDTWLSEMKVEGYVGAPLLDHDRNPIGVIAALFTRPLHDAQLAESILQLFSTRIATQMEVRKSHTELLNRERRLQTLLGINNALVSKLRAEELFPAIWAGLHSIFQQDFAGLAIYDAKTETMKAHALECCFEEEIADMAVPLNQSLAGRAFKAGVPMVFSHNDLREAHYEIVERLVSEGIQNLCCVPLITARGTSGVLTLGSKEKDAYQSIDLSLTLEIGKQVALVLDNSCAFQGLTQLKDRLEEENCYLQGEVERYSFEEIIGASAGLKKVLSLARTVAGTNSTALLLGETGTGKELVARAIHRMSARSDKNFVKMNCAAIPAGLLESELFGHEKGAFTGALTAKPGRLEVAHEGTLFLDEVGDLPLELQPKLLRVLQDHEFERLGSNRTIRTDVRLIAATNHDLFARVAEREFRSDLFYRLNVFPIRIPALRERRGDIPLLTVHFVRKYAERMKKKIDSIPNATLEALARWRWPGNVRELENFIERSVILTTGPVLQAPLKELRAGQESGSCSTLEEIERKYILTVLRESGGIISGPAGAAKKLGLKRTTLQSKIQRLGISPNEYRICSDTLDT